MTLGDYMVLREGANETKKVDWREVSLTELGEVDRGRSRHRPRHAPELYGGPYPFVQTGDIKASGGRITTHKQTYSDAGLAQSRLWPAGTMAITIAANIAETAILTYPACFPDSVVGFLADESKCDVRFIEYMFRLLRNKLQHENVGTGSVQDNINLQTLGRLRFSIPPLPEQRAISHVLGTFDDKIELNWRMNETLEQMARALFKSWFVDFDPVRAKMERRWRPGQSLPGLPAHLYDLFPSRLVPSELGPIPDGWEVGSVSQLANRIQNGGTPKRSEPTYWDVGEIPWLTSGEVRQSFVLDTQNFISRLGLAHSSAKMAPARSILVALYGATAGHVCMNIHPLSTNQAVSAIVPTDGNRYYCLVSLKSKVAELANRAVGSAQQNISKKTVESTILVLPPIELRSKYDTMVEGSFEQVCQNLDESRTLAALRDALLPGLLSAEVRVGQAERFVHEEAG